MEEYLHSQKNWTFCIQNNMVSKEYTAGHIWGIFVLDIIRYFLWIVWFYEFWEILRALNKKGIISPYQFQLNQSISFLLKLIPLEGITIVTCFSFCASCEFYIRGIWADQRVLLAKVPTKYRISLKEQLVIWNLCSGTVCCRDRSTTCAVVSTKTISIHKQRWERSQHRITICCCHHEG